jgi:hypothetical protein
MMVNVKRINPPPLDAGELEQDLLVQLYPPLQDPQKYLRKVKVKISIRLFVRHNLSHALSSVGTNLW